MIIFAINSELYSSQFKIYQLGEMKSPGQIVKQLRLVPCPSIHQVDNYNVIIFKERNGKIFRTDDWGSTWYPHVLISDEKFSLQLYPNPAHDFITIQLPANDNIIFEVDIFDISGMIYGKYYVDTNDSNLIDVSFLPRGFYFLRLVGELGNYHVSFVKH